MKKSEKSNSLKETVVTFLTARSEDYSQIAGFEAGADDYITKPIRPKVLVSRVKALLKRRGITKDTDAIIELGDIVIDKEKHLTTYKGQD